MPAPQQDPRWAGITRLILGSKSWSRRHLLSQLRVPAFDTLAPDIDEAAIRRSDARALVLAIARAKARALLARPDVARTAGRTLLICGDSVVTHNGAVLGKPVSPDHARALLRSYAAAPATTVASVLVVDVAARTAWEGVDEAEVYFRAIPDDVVDELVTTGGSMESAGALRIEHPAVQPYIDCIMGHRSAVMGFSQPLCEQLLSDALSGVGGTPI